MLGICTMEIALWLRRRRTAAETSHVSSYGGEGRRDGDGYKGEFFLLFSFFFITKNGFQYVFRYPVQV